MQATEDLRTLRASLDIDKFKALVKAFKGDLKDYEIGALFGMDDSEWSLVANGKRDLPKHVLPILMFKLFPDIPPRAYMKETKAIRRGES